VFVTIVAPYLFRLERCCWEATTVEEEGDTDDDNDGVI